MEAQLNTPLTPQERLKAAKARKAKAVEEMKQILTDICIKQTSKAPTNFQVL